MSQDSYDSANRELEPNADDATWSLLAAALEPQLPATELRARLLAELHGPQRFAPFAAEIATAFAMELDAVQKALASCSDASAWQPGFWPGSWSLSSDALRAAHAVIARLPGGIRIPSHTHPGRELTYVLDGELLENGTTRLRPGNLLSMQPGSRHDITVPDGDECLVVFALPRG